MDNKTDVVKRLNRIEGQVAGVRRMVESDRGCIDIITQVNAVRAALDKVALELVRHSIEDCFEEEANMDPETQADISQLLSRLMSK